ncbi:MAG TPA: hypothetical protein PKI03_32340 [Pseudomonadota bacterium]|nr:hypothetical protein [Pseudomonadota bacterium]
MRRGPMGWLCGLGGLCLLGCGGGERDDLAITAVPPISASVGREVSIPLAVPVPTADARDRAGGSVDWDWRSLTLPDLPNRLRRPTLTAYTLGRAVWRWTPVATDQGPQEIEFIAHLPQSHLRGQLVLNFVVDSGIGSAVFREPVGEGTTLDLRREECAHVAIVVESSVSARVELSLGGDPPATARLVPQGDTTGELVFCPSPEQIAADTIYPFVLQAQDDRQTIQKTYVIVLRRAV